MDFLDCCWPIGGAWEVDVDEVGGVWEDCGRDLDNLEARTESRVGARLGKTGLSITQTVQVGWSNLVYPCLFACLQHRKSHCIPTCV